MNCLDMQLVSHLHGGGVVVDEVAGGLHGHPAEKIRPGFGQLVDV